MSKAHDELRKRLNAYREAKALYDGPDPYDREEARYDAMRVALGRIGYDETLAQSLLDDHERLRAIFDDAGQGEYNVLALVEHYQQAAMEADERLGLAYPRALQAAADVVLNADISLFDDEASGLGWLDDVANCICDLTEEQIEAFDAKVEREHAAAVAPKPARPVVIWHYRDDEEELPSCDDVDEAIYNAIHAAGWGMCGKLERPGMLEETVTVYGFARMAPKVQAWRYLEQVLEDLDEEHSDGSATKATPAMVEAADAFAAAIEREYVSWACEVVEKRVVNVREWCAVHRPGWLAQLPAVEPKEGGDHG